MIDFIHIKVPFKSEFLLVEKDDHAFLNEKVLDELAVCTNVRKDEDGDITNVSVPWHSVQSGQSSVAFKISLPRIKGFPNIEFKASPAKVKAGHNVYGPDDMEWAIFAIIDALVDERPYFANYFDWQIAELIRFDVTYHNFSPNSSHKEAQDFLQAMKVVSNRSVKSAVDDVKGLQTYKTTAYWNPRSDVKTLKLYLKKNEIEYRRNNTKDIELYSFDQVYTPKLIAYCEGMLRWEAQIKRKWMIRRGYSTLLKDIIREYKAGNFNPKDIWQESFKDLFASIEGQDLKLMTQDDDVILQKLLDSVVVERTYTRKVTVVYGKTNELDKCLMNEYKIDSQEELTPDVVVYKLSKVTYSDGQARKAFQMYKDIKRMGWDQVKAETSKRTFLRNLSHLEKAGVSRGYLQQCESTEPDRSNVIPFTRYIVMEFGAQFPEWADVEKEFYS